MPSRLTLLSRALKHRNFRIFFLGQSVSLTGTWMQQVAMGWLAYRLTHSPLILGFVGFAAQIPTFFLAPFAGVLADRWHRRRIVLITQTLSMIQAFVLTGLVITGNISIAWIIALSILIGLLNAFDVPARQSFLIEMIGKREDLGNAIALNSSMFNAARLIGPTIAGILIVFGGEALCFFINGLSYLAVILAIASMKILPAKRIVPDYPIWDGLKEGLSYVRNFFPMRAILTLLGLVSLMGAPYTVLMPVFAKEILRGGPATLGFLMGATGFGAFVGAVSLALRPDIRGLLPKIATSAIFFGISLILFSFSEHFWPCLILLVFAGFGLMTQTIASNIVLQSMVDDDKRGRVMSFFTVALMGMTPFGSLAAGGIADHIGAPETIRIGGAACVLAGIIFLSRLGRMRQMVREVYAEKGIIH